MKDKKNQGFTLIELLISISIFSILIVAIYSSFSSGLLASKKGETVVDLLQTGQEALGRISTELSNAIILSDYQFIGERDRISFVTLLPRSETELSSIYRITYYLSGEEESLLMSLRRKSQPVGQECEDLDLIYSCVKDLKFRYAYQENSENPIQWTAFWFGSEDSPLPLSIEIDLTLMSDKERISLNKIICIPVTESNETSNVRFF